MATFIITTLPGEATVCVQVGRVPPRRMSRADAERLAAAAKTIDEGVTIERRIALGTIMIVEHSSHGCCGA